MVIVSLNSNVNCNRYFSTSHSKFNPTVEIHTSDTSPVVSYSAVETQQIENVQKPVVQESVKQEPVKEQPIKQEAVKQEPVKEEPVKEEPVKEVPIKQEPVKQPVKEAPAPEPISEVHDHHEVHHHDKEVITETTCSTCGKAKPDYTKALAILKKGHVIAAIATAKVAAPAVITSAKVAGLAALIPVKMAATGAIVGTLIAKPIIIQSAIVGATAAKLSYLLVGKPIAIGSKLLAGAAALKAKVIAKKTKCGEPKCV